MIFELDAKLVVDDLTRNTLLGTEVIYIIQEGKSLFSLFSNYSNIVKYSRRNANIYNACFL